MENHILNHLKTNKVLRQANIMS